jgi:hypothetical protein
MKLLLFIIFMLLSYQAVDVLACEIAQEPVNELSIIRGVK